MHQPKASLQLKEIAGALTLLFMLMLALNAFASDLLLPITLILFIFSSAYLIAQFSINSFFLLLVFLMPFSSTQKFLNSEVMLMIPSEPFSAIIMIAFALKLLFGYRVSSKVWKHPLFFMVLLFIALQSIAIFGSSMPIVSIKSMLIKMCYATVFFFIAADLYVKQQINHKDVLKTYMIAMLCVGFIIFYQHWDYGLSKDYSGTATEPFYADHTIYSACLALVIPLPLLSLIKNEGYSFFKKSGLLLFITILLLFFFLTYCRAGWISFIAAALITWSVAKGISFSQLLLFTIIAVASLFFTWNDLSAELKKNKADSNAKNADIEQQTKSVVNITNDQSNAERLNRWKSALRMFADKPLLGFGPGTYQFEYLSYQRKSEMTRISVTSPYVAKKGKGGTAHSEYLLLLSECGILAFINWLVLIFAVLYYGIKIYHTSSSQADKLQTLIIIFGFSSYLVHGLFNNFLDTDKAAILFYSSIAGILSISIKSELIHRSD